MSVSRNIKPVRRLLIRCVQLCYWVAQVCGCVIVAFLCDSKFLGQRQQRAMLACVVVFFTILGPWTAHFRFLATHNFNRHRKAYEVDWEDGSE
jgi:sugar phosphate permease